MAAAAVAAGERAGEPAAVPVERDQRPQRDRETVLGPEPVSTSASLVSLALRGAGTRNGDRAGRAGRYHLLRAARPSRWPRSGTWCRAELVGPR
jgi:hypothetical protein